MNWAGIIGALLICFVWIDFLRRLDIFEPEKWKYTFMATGLGAVFTFIWSFILLIPGIRDAGPADDALSILQFFIFNVALPEEIAKIIPVFIMLAYTRELDEPYDYLKFAMCSALGFATVENIQYFDQHGSEIIDKRAYLSVVGHLTFSCFMAYGLVRHKMFGRGNLPLNILLFGSISIVTHGLFDSLLTFSPYGNLLFIPFFYLLVVVLRNMINTTLNFSPWFEDGKFEKIKSAFTILIIGLLLVFFYAALMITIESGTEAGIAFVTENFLLSGSLIFFIPNRLSGMVLEKNNRVDILTRK
jgi:RsiW-degrading membrane proteinase PrsW (M82 family)